MRSTASGLFSIKLPALPSDERLSLLEGLDLVMMASEQDETPLGGLSVGGSDGGETDEALADYLSVGGSVWPCAEALCRWLLSNSEGVRGSSILELGSGTGACGLYAAGLGASRVTLTDGSEGLLALIDANRERNAHLFNGKVDVEQFLWNRRPPPVGPWDLVLGSDLTYVQEEGAHEALASTLSALLRREGGDDADSPSKPRVLLSHEHRSRLPNEVVSGWDDRDEMLRKFGEAAADFELELLQVGSSLPRPDASAGAGLEAVRHEISIIEVRGRHV